MLPYVEKPWLARLAARAATFLADLPPCTRAQRRATRDHARHAVSWHVRHLASVIPLCIPSLCLHLLKALSNLAFAPLFYINFPLTLASPSFNPHFLHALRRSLVCIMPPPPLGAETCDLNDVETALSDCLATEPQNERLLNALSSLHQVVSQPATLHGEWRRALTNIRRLATAALTTLTQPLRTPDSLRRLASAAQLCHTELDADGFHSALSPHVYHSITLRNLSECVRGDLYPFLTSLSSLFKVLEVLFRAPVTSTGPETALATVPVEQVPPAAGAKVQDASADRYIALLASQRSFLSRIRHISLPTSSVDRLRRFASTLTAPLLLDPDCIRWQTSEHPFFDARLVAKNQAACIQYATLRVKDGSRHLWDAAVALKIFEISNSSRQHHFGQEALRMRTLAHPCIPLFHGHYANFQADGKRRVVVATERMSCDLRSAKNMHCLNSFEVRVSVLHDVAKALAFLHKNSVYYASLKPENVLLRIHAQGLQGPAKLDVTCILRRALHLSSCRPRVYEPPEVYSNGFEAYYTGDIWSFGVLATFLLTDGCSEEDDTEFFKLAMTKGCIYPARAWTRRVPDSGFRNLIAKCLVEVPTHRITAQQLVEEIEVVLRTKDGNPPGVSSDEKAIEDLTGNPLELFVAPPIAEGLHFEAGLEGSMVFGCNIRQGNKSSNQNFRNSDHSWASNVGSDGKKEPLRFRMPSSLKRIKKKDGMIHQHGNTRRQIKKRRRFPDVVIDADLTPQKVEAPNLESSPKNPSSRFAVEIPHIDLTEVDANSLLQYSDEDSISVEVRRKRLRLHSPGKRKEKRSPSDGNRSPHSTSPKSTGSTKYNHKVITHSPNRVSLKSPKIRRQKKVFSEPSSSIANSFDVDLASKDNQAGSKVEKEQASEAIHKDRTRGETHQFPSRKGNFEVPSSLIADGMVPNSPVGAKRKSRKRVHEKKSPSSRVGGLESCITMTKSSKVMVAKSGQLESFACGDQVLSIPEAHNLSQRQIKHVKSEPIPAMPTTRTKQQIPQTAQESSSVVPVPEHPNTTLRTSVKSEPLFFSGSELYDPATIIGTAAACGAEGDEKEFDVPKNVRKRRRTISPEVKEPKDENKASKSVRKVSASNTPWAGRMRKRTSRKYSEEDCARFSDSDSIDFVAAPHESSDAPAQSMSRTENEKKVFKQLVSIRDKGLSNILSSVKKTEYDAIGISANSSCFLDCDVQGVYALGKLKGSKDRLDPFQYFKREAVKGDTMAQVRLGVLYENGFNCQRDYGEAFYYFELASSMENNEGRLRLARCYEEGRGVSKNESAAVALYLQAAAANSPVAHYKAAKCFLEGRGVIRDVKRAVSHLEEAYEGDLLEAAYCLADLYSEGKQIQQDYTKAFYLYGSAAQSGFLPAKVKFAHCYAKGKGCRRNISKAVEYYRKAAAAGDPEALLSMGLLYEDGNGVKASKQKALDSYIRSARQMYPPGITALGQCYLWGYGVDQDYYKAKALFEKAAELSDALALLELGNCYRFGRGCDRDVKKAVLLYHKACDQGNSVAMVEYGECHYYGKEVDLNYDKAFALFQKAAELGAAEGYRWLGDCYADSIGTRQDYRKATQMYRKGIELGSAAAQNRLGKMYEHGYGVEKNKIKAIQCYRKAADKGNDTAMNNLGISYERGELVKRDYVKAVSYYMKAKEHGCVDAICNLADCYALGNGVEKNSNRAFELYKEAAEYGLASAVCELGVCYYKGLGVVPDHNRAMELLERIKGEEPEALRQLGIIYYDGIAVPQDYKKAFKLFDESVQKGNKNAYLSLALCLLNGYGVEKDEKRAFAALKEASNDGNKSAHMFLGNCYFDGIGVPKDLEMAAKCFQKGEDANPLLS